MIFISPKNEYPRYYGDIIEANPEWKLDDDLPEGWVEVKDVPCPTPGQDQTVDEEFPIEVNGEMVRKFVVRDLTPEEIAHRDAPETARARMKALGFTDSEITALSQGSV